MTYLSIKRVPISIFTNNVSILLKVALIRSSPSLLDRLIFPVLIICIFIAEHSFSFCLFLASFIQYSRSNLLATSFGGASLSNRSLVAYNTFLIIKTDSRTLYAVFPLTRITIFCIHSYRVCSCLSLFTYFVFYQCCSFLDCYHIRCLWPTIGWGRPHCSKFLFKFSGDVADALEYNLVLLVHHLG